MTRLVFPKRGSPLENSLLMLEAKLNGFSNTEIFRAQRSAGWAYAPGSESAMISHARKEVKRIPGRIRGLTMRIKRLEKLQKRFEGVEL